jgi:hypothetical protein
MIYGARPSTLWHKAAALAPFVALARANRSAALSSDKSAITAAVLRLIILVNNGEDWLREQTGRPGAALFARRAQSDGFGFCVMEFDDGAKPLCLNLRRRLVASLSLCLYFGYYF